MSSSAARHCRQKPRPRREGSLRPTDVVGAFFICGIAFLLAAAAVGVAQATRWELRDLGRLLNDHVRFEERELFPMVEEALDPDDVARLAIAIERAEGNL
ncbi:MAG: hypothetical protein U0R26_08290 [Solirubrobacterales bacterium]